MSATPNFAITPRIGMGQVTTANTARDGTGTIATIFSAGASGSTILRAQIVAAGTTTAGVIRLFLHDGTNARLLEELLVPAWTPGVSGEVWQGHVSYIGAPFPLPVNWSVRASTHIGETFNVIVYGADY